MIGVWPAIARAKHLNHTSNHIRIRHFHTHTHKVLSNNNLDLVHCSWGSVLEYVTDQLNSEFVVAITQTFRELSSLVVKLKSCFVTLSFPTDRIYLGSFDSGSLSWLQAFGNCHARRCSKR